MSQKSFIIFSPTRTGSTLIVGNINKYFDTDAIHTHDQLYVPPHDNFICILSKRHNLFESTCSQLMMEYTNEESVYSNKLLSPFKADPGKFISCYRNQLNYYNQIDLSRYKQIIEVYYEQLINDPDYLFGLLGIKEKTDYTLVNKSTNNYYNLFTNIAQLKLIADNYHDDMKICNSCPNLIGCRPSECVEKK